jgi:hypothetical protein
MRGKTALPFTRRGAELSTVGVPGGRGLAGGVEVGVVGVTPGGSFGGRTNGEPEVPPAPAAASAGSGVAVAAVEPGHASVRNDPRASAVMPFRQRARTWKRYVVWLEPAERGLRRCRRLHDGRRRPDPVAVVDAHLDHDACCVRHVPLHDGRERPRVHAEDGRSRSGGRPGTTRDEHGEGAQREQDGDGEAAPQHEIKVGTAVSAVVPSDE